MGRPVDVQFTKTSPSENSNRFTYLVSARDELGELSDNTVSISFPMRDKYDAKGMRFLIRNRIILGDNGSNAHDNSVNVIITADNLQKGIAFAPIKLEVPARLESEKVSKNDLINVVGAHCLFKSDQFLKIIQVANNLPFPGPSTPGKKVFPGNKGGKSRPKACGIYADC